MNIGVSIGSNFQDTATMIEYIQMKEIFHKVQMTTEAETHPVNKVIDLDHHIDTELGHAQRAVIDTDEGTSSHASIRVFRTCDASMR